MKLIREATGDTYVFPSDKNLIKIGRNQQCDIVFTSIHISRDHCQIRRIPPSGTYVLRNNAAHNHTFVDDIELRTPEELAELKHGALIGLGVPSSLLCQANKNHNYIFLKVCLQPDNLQCCPVPGPSKIQIKDDSKDVLDPIKRKHQIDDSSDISGSFDIPPGKKKRRLIVDYGSSSKKPCIKTESPFDVIEISSDEEKYIPSPPSIKKICSRLSSQKVNTHVNKSAEKLVERATHTGILPTNENLETTMHTSQSAEENAEKIFHLGQSPEKNVNMSKHHIERLTQEQSDDIFVQIDQSPEKNVNMSKHHIERLTKEHSDDIFVHIVQSTEKKDESSKDADPVIPETIDMSAHPKSGSTYDHTLRQNNIRIVKNKCHIHLEKLKIPLPKHPLDIMNQENNYAFNKIEFKKSSNDKHVKTTKDNHTELHNNEKLITSCNRDLQKSEIFSEPNYNILTVKDLKGQNSVILQDELELGLKPVEPSEKNMDAKIDVLSDLGVSNVNVKIENSDDEEDKLYIALPYSQINETILISSDEDDDSCTHSNVNRPQISAVSVSSEEYDLDASFEGGVLSQSGMLSSRIKTEMNKENLVDSMEIPIDTNEREMMSDDDDIFFPILSQNFYDSDKTDSTVVENEGSVSKQIIVVENESLSKPINDETTMKCLSGRSKDEFPSLEASSPYNRIISHKKDLNTIIKKVSNKEVSKTKQIDTLEAISYSKRKLFNRSKSKDEGHSSRVTKCHDRSKKNITEKKSVQSINGGQGSKKTTTHHKRTINIRDNLIKTHSLEPYKEKGKHHYHRNNATENNVPIGKKDERKKSHNENISIQKRDKTDLSSVPKGIAKDSKKSKIQQLIDIDMFPSTKNNNCNEVKKIKAPKINRNNVNKIITEKSIAKIDKSCPINNSSEALDQNNYNLSTANCSTHQPKRVRFANESELVQVRPISPREPNLIHQSLSVEGYAFIISRPYSTYEIICHICNWNYDWLATYKKLKEDGSAKRPTELPPVANGPLPTLLIYNSYKDYKDIFSNLMYLETWEAIYRDWNIVNSKPKWLSAFVDVSRSVEMDNHGRPLKCHYIKVIILLNRSLLLDKDYPCMGYLIVIKNRLNSKAKHTIAYVDSMTKHDGVKLVTQNLKDCSPQDANATLTLELIMTKNPFNDETHSGNIVMIGTLSYIRPTFKTYEALCKLPQSPLMPHLLKPGNPSMYDSCNMNKKYLVDKMRLNDAQIKAVIEISDKCCNKPLCPSINLIHGPPGTGKTRTILALVSQIIKMLHCHSRSDKRVLVCAPSNAAVDLITERLHHLNNKLNIVRVGITTSMSAEAKTFSFDAKMKKRYAQLIISSCNKSIQNEVERLEKAQRAATVQFEAAVKSNKAKCKILETKMIAAIRSSENLQKQCISDRSSEEKDRFWKHAKQLVLLEADVIATTLSSCASGSLESLDLKVPNFACCIVDEAGQCKETEIWLPIMLKITKLVLVGDHKQLPATVLSIQASEKSLHQSLFERFYTFASIQKGQFNQIHCLTVQYRMHEEIMSWPSRHFYNNSLMTPPSVNKERRLRIKPYIIFDIKDSIEVKRGRDISNEMEAIFIQNLFETLEPYIKKLSVGVITPYQEQKHLLLRKLHRYTDLKLTVSTVDTFQGQEKDIIICSFVRANVNRDIGFVSHKQRLNVSLTRARRSCIIVGNLNSFQDNTDWRALTEDGRRRGVVHNIHKEKVEKKLLKNLLFIDP